ncbi:MAG: HAMP domain-containing protein, partial [Deltaproteobacteria bacterium]|nr:HAMP domain-containing protein [Deltaproteobacteria bacterium]
MPGIKTLSIRAKLLLTGILATIVPLLIITLVASWQAGEVETIAEQEVMRLSHANNEAIVAGVVGMVTSQQEVLEQKVSADLNVARHVMKQAGPVTFSQPGVSWRVSNQFTREETTVSLPKMAVGGQWLGQNDNIDHPSAIVDNVKELVGGTCTIFQRMNEAGDMLRISTNVETLAGKRAIGTFIPAVNPDGKPNPVLAQVLSGKTFIGRAFVVNAWYITAYEPIRDAFGRISGVLYVGVPEESAASLRRQVMDITVGQTGYVYVLDSKGKYIISQKGRRDGEVIWETRDADGKFFIQEIIQKATALKPGEFAQVRYPWQNPGDPSPRMKSVSVAYFPQWDWIIGAGTFDDEFFAGLKAIKEADRRSSMIMWSVLAAALVAVGITWLLIASRITGPIRRLMGYAEAVAKGDLDAQSKVDQKDEIGKLNLSIQSMVHTLKQKMTEAETQASEAEQKAHECTLATEEAEQAKREAEQAKRQGMLQAAE